MCKSLTKYHDEKSTVLMGQIGHLVDTNSDESLDSEVIRSHAVRMGRSPSHPMMIQ